MVSIENLFNNAFSAIRTQPKILLPLVLNWIPGAVISVAVSLIASDIIKEYTYDRLRSAFGADPIGFTHALLKNYSSHSVFIILALLLSIFIFSFVNAVYPTLSYQIYYRKKILLSEAVSTAKQRYLKVLWTNILFGILSVFAIVVAIIIAIILLIIILIAIGIAGTFVGGSGIIGLIIGGIIVLIAAILLLALTAYISAIWVILEPIVVIENLSGLSAIEKAHKILKGKLGEVWIFIILLAVANGLYFWMAGLIAGAVEFLIGSYTIVIEMILMLLPSAFILLSYGLLYLEISPASINLSGSSSQETQPQGQNNNPQPLPEQPK
ncbi:MAG: hypothetical protein U9Q92_01815 [archaeon]|nr:hypothetical protein [archaeon]